MTDMNARIKGKKVLITGASSGIGERIAHLVAEQGAFPILVARSEHKLKAMITAMEQKGYEAVYYACDIQDAEKWQQVMEQIIDEQHQIHIVINNAGFGIFEKVKEMQFEDFYKMFAVNVHGLIQASHFFVQHMLKMGEGHIVNIASQAGKMATPKAAGYAATKHAVLGFTNGLRMEVEEEGIFVTSVNLGPVKTNFFQTADPTGGYEKAVQKYLLNPDVVAEKIVNRLYRKTREINLPKWMELGSRMYHLFPKTFEKVFKKQFSKK